MAKRIGAWVAERNKLYKLESPENKVALGVLESGIEIDQDKKIIYEPKIGKAWLGKLARELDVSRSTIVDSLDTLFDSRILSPPMNKVLELVEDSGTRKYVRTYSISKEYQESLVQLYYVTHTITKKLDTE